MTRAEADKLIEAIYHAPWVEDKIDGDTIPDIDLLPDDAIFLSDVFEIIERFVEG